MKKAIFITIYCMLVLGCLVLVFNYGYNTFLIYRYNQNNYSMDAKPLTLFNWTESYVAYYNQGNIYYQQGDYISAIEAYEKALDANPPEEKECSIRINLALAWIMGLGDSYDDPDTVESSIILLNTARDVLLENGCATEEGDGHNATAQKLKDEIDAILEQLEQQQKEAEPEDGEESKDEKKTDSTEEKKENDAFEEDVKKAIQEKQSKANKERQEGMQYYEDFDKDYNFDSDGKIW